MGGRGLCRNGAWSSGSGSMQSLVQCLERECSSSLGLGTSGSALSAATVGVHNAGKATLGPRACLLVACIDVLG